MADNQNCPGLQSASIVAIKVPLAASIPVFKAAFLPFPSEFKRRVLAGSAFSSASQFKVLSVELSLTNSTSNMSRGYDCPFREAINEGRFAASSRNATTTEIFALPLWMVIGGLAFNHALRRNNTKHEYRTTGNISAGSNHMMRAISSRGLPRGYRNNPIFHLQLVQ